MALIVPNDGEDSLIDMMLEDAAGNNQEVHLYTAGTAGETATVGTFTEATFTGYALITLTRATWGAPSGGTKAYPQQSWSPTSSETVTGYWVEEETAGGILWCEEFAVARALANGDTLNLDLSISLA